MNLIERDLQHIWHPCSQMKDYASFPPLEIERAEGSRLYLRDGSTVIDAISSWWCKTLGHGHPRLRAALEKQAGRYEHVILANTAQDTLVELSERLTSLSPSLTRVFYAGDGSMAVEIALKMSLHAHSLRGNRRRTQFMALENGYHGESTGALALSDLGIYKEAYAAWLPEVKMLRGLPYGEGPGAAGESTGEGPAAARWDDCATYWPSLEAQLDSQSETLCAVVVEPVLQGAGGMRLYSPDLLRRLRKWTREHDVYLIADEILTGFGRTGKMLAMEHAGIEADFVCLSKGLTAGWLPLSAMLTSDAVYDLFYGDYKEGRSFLHSNTYAGNALAAAVALEAQKIYAEEDICAKARKLESKMREGWEALAARTGRLTRIRALGGMAAADLRLEPGEAGKRTGYQVYQAAVRHGALLRPLGDTLYWLPPLNIDDKTLAELIAITGLALEETLGYKQ